MKKVTHVEIMSAEIVTNVNIYLIVQMELKIDTIYNNTSIGVITWKKYTSKVIILIISSPLNLVKLLLMEFRIC